MAEGLRSQTALKEAAIRQVTEVMNSKLQDITDTISKMDEKLDRKFSEMIAALRVLAGVGTSASGDQRPPSHSQDLQRLQHVHDPMIHESRMDDDVSENRADRSFTKINEDTGEKEVRLGPSLDLVERRTHFPSSLFSCMEKLDEIEIKVSQSEVLSSSHSFCIQDVRQNDYEKLTLFLPPEKRPDEFINVLKALQCKMFDESRGLTNGIQLAMVLVWKIMMFNMKEIADKSDSWCYLEHIVEDWLGKPPHVPPDLVILSAFSRDASTITITARFAKLVKAFGMLSEYVWQLTSPIECLLIILSSVFIKTEDSDGKALIVVFENKCKLSFVWIIRDLQVGNTLLDMYANCSSVVYMSRIYVAMDVKDLVTRTTLIAGYVRNNCNLKAIESFKEAHTGVQDINPLMILMNTVKGLQCQIMISHWNFTMEFQVNQQRLVLQGIKPPDEFWNTTNETDVVSAMTTGWIWFDEPHWSLDDFEFFKVSQVLFPYCKQISLQQLAKVAVGFRWTIARCIHGDSPSVHWYAYLNSIRLASCDKYFRTIFWLLVWVLNKTKIVMKSSFIEPRFECSENSGHWVLEHGAVFITFHKDYNLAGRAFSVWVDIIRFEVIHEIICPLPRVHRETYVQRYAFCGFIFGVCNCGHEYRQWGEELMPLEVWSMIWVLFEVFINEGTQDYYNRASILIFGLDICREWDLCCFASRKSILLGHILVYHGIDYVTVVQWVTKPPPRPPEFMLSQRMLQWYTLNETSITTLEIWLLLKKNHLMHLRIWLGLACSLTDIYTSKPSKITEYNDSLLVCLNTYQSLLEFSEWIGSFNVHNWLIILTIHTSTLSILPTYRQGVLDCTQNLVLADGYYGLLEDSYGYKTKSGISKEKEIFGWRYNTCEIQFVLTDTGSATSGERETHVSWNYFGLFKVLGRCGSIAYRLELLPSSRIHSIFILFFSLPRPPEVPTFKP